VLASLARVSSPLWPAPRGRDVRALLSAVGLPDETVAAVAGISVRTLFRWTKYGLPSEESEEKWKLLAVLNVAVSWLAAHAPNVLEDLVHDGVFGPADDAL